MTARPGFRKSFARCAWLMALGGCGVPVPALSPRAPLIVAQRRAAPAPAPAPPEPDADAPVRFTPPEEVYPESTCTFDADAPHYEGQLEAFGKPFADASLIDGAAGTVDLFPDTLRARGSWSKAGRSILAEITLPELALRPRYPLVYDGWVEVLETRIRSLRSMHGAQITPEVAMPPWIKPVRAIVTHGLPCRFLMASAEDLESPASYAGDVEPGTKLTLHRVPRGAVVAQVKVPPVGADFSLEIVGEQGGWAYVVLGSRETRFRGWATGFEQNDVSGSVFGRVGTFALGPGSAAHTRRYWQCANIAVYVAGPGGALRLVMEQNKEAARFDGTLDGEGNLRVDLGDASEDAAPFVPKPYLARCVERTETVGGVR